MLNITVEDGSTKITFSAPKGNGMLTTYLLVAPIVWGMVFVLLYEIIFQLTQSVQHPLLFALGYFFFFSFALLFASAFTWAVITTQYGIQNLVAAGNGVVSWLSIGNRSFRNRVLEKRKINGVIVEKIRHKRRHSAEYFDFTVLADYDGKNVPLLRLLNHEQALKVEKHLQEFLPSRLV